MAPVGNLSLDDRQRIRALVEQHDYSGFGDLDHLATIPSQNRGRLHNRLYCGDFADGVPFPASLAIVRAVLRDSYYRDLVGAPGLGVQPEQLRFAVYHRQMGHAKEVSYSDLQEAFARIRFHRDVAMDETRFFEGAGQTGEEFYVVEWRNYEFYSIPASTSNALWDLFEIEKTTWASDRSEHRQHMVLNDLNDEVAAFSPILVAADRNMDVVARFKREGLRIPAVPMSQHGAALHLSLFEGPRSPQPGLYESMAETHFTMLGKSSDYSRRLSEGETWLVATYEPPPTIRFADAAHMRYIGLAESNQSDIWVRDLPVVTAIPRS